MKIQHIRHYIVSILLITLLISCSSQEFIQYNLSEKIDDNIVWKVIKSNDINQAPASINILDINLNKLDGEVILAWNKGKLLATSEIAQENNGTVAINGSFFDLSKTGGSVLFLQEDGKVIQETHDKIEFINEGAYAMDTSGVISILKRDGDWSYSPAYDDIIVSGPLLIHDNELCNLDSVRFNRIRNPRTAIGITDDYHLILFTVDGRHAEAAGMNMWELQSFMHELGCSAALNLDGGGSTTMYIKGKSENGLVNYPSDNGKYDHEGERKVSNAIVLVK